MRILVAVIALGLAGCVDTKTCHNPQSWKPCPNTQAQPGAAGTPPAIVELSLPTCVYVDQPIAHGSLHATDPDGDVAKLVATFYQGARNNESEILLAGTPQSGTELTGDIAVALQGAGGTGTPMESTFDAVIKAVDAQGAQSVPYCNAISAVR